jgi:hypothetical protein
MFLISFLTPFIFKCQLQWTIFFPPLIYPLHKHKPKACMHKHKANVFINILVWKVFIQNNYTSLRSLSIRASLDWLSELHLQPCKVQLFPIGMDSPSWRSSLPSLAKLKCKTGTWEGEFLFFVGEILTWKIWFRPKQRIFHGNFWLKSTRFLNKIK